MSKDKAVLLDIIHAARLAIEFQNGLSKEKFLQDIKTQSAVLHQLMVMGEAVKRLSTSFREQHDDIPWRLMAGLRDVLIHGYDIVDLSQVWKTVNSEIPELLPQLEAIHLD